MNQVNEIKRLVIETPLTAMDSVLGPEVVGVAIEKVDSVERCTSLIESPAHAFVLIGVVCSERAVDVVGGEMVVAGERIKPEDYIPLWRQALVDRKTIRQALEQDGIKLTFFARGHLERQRGEKRYRTDDPMDSFDSWIEKYGERMKLDEDGYFTLELPGEEEGASSAWLFIKGYRRYSDCDPRNESSMSVSVVKSESMTAVADRQELVAAEVQASLFN